MSKYTTEVRYICEAIAGRLESEGYNGINQIIADSRAKIFSFDYPMFDDNYKPVLESKILKHYYTREICAETYGRWKLFLESRMQEIMPYYNELYKTTLLEYDILEDVNYTRSGNRTGNETGSNSSTGSLTHSGTDSRESELDHSGTDSRESELDHSGTDSRTDTSEASNVTWQKYSDTPQGSVQNIDNDSYLTNATKNTSDDEGTLSSTGQNAYIDKNAESGQNAYIDTRTESGQNAYTDNRTDSGQHANNTVEQYIEVIKGKYPGRSYMELIKQFRENLLNIDKMIIEELSDLFMMVY